MTKGPQVFTSNARQEAARDEATAAKDAAADAFVTLDAVQKNLTMLVTAFAGLDAGPAGDRLRRAYDPLHDAADQASQRWIDTLDAHQRVLDDERAELRTLRAAQDAFLAAHSVLAGAERALHDFAAAHPDIETKVQAAWAEVATRTTAARQALSQAQEAVARTRATGVTSPRLDRLLAEAEQVAQPVFEGPHKHGAAQTLAACTRVVAAAADVTATAHELGRTAEETRRRLGSTRTRLEAVAGRIEGVEPLLSRLRRQFLLACSVDLDDVPQHARAQVDEAAQLLAAARTHASTGRWEAAADDLRRCRERLTVAEARLTAVADRVRDLEEVAADPARVAARTRFAVRDAQRLVVAAGDKAASVEAGILDSLVVRLEAVDARLEERRPDFWGYLQELRAIGDVAESVVRRVRDAIASR